MPSPLNGLLNFGQEHAMIRIFDTTLRDGEQSPGFAMTLGQKLVMAKQIEALGVDVIEAGFPAASSDDFRAVKEIAQSCREVEVCALARCHAGTSRQPSTHSEVPQSQGFTCLFPQVTCTYDTNCRYRATRPLRKRSWE